MLTQVVLIGRLADDPGMKRVGENDTPTTGFVLAVDRDRGDDADFIKIVTWNRLAENCAQYLEKGQTCAVVGRLQIRSFEGDDGNRRYMTEVVARNVKFMQKPRNRQEGAGIEDAKELYDGDEINPGEDVPF